MNILSKSPIINLISSCDCVYMISPGGPDGGGARLEKAEGACCETRLGELTDAAKGTAIGEAVFEADTEGARGEGIVLGGRAAGGVAMAEGAGRGCGRAPAGATAGEA